MSLLEAVTEARELCDAAKHEFERAVVRASDGGYSLRKIGAAARMSFNNIRAILLRAREENGK